MSKNILVTGGAGFIGSFIVDELIKRGHRVKIFDNLDPQVHPDNNPPEYLNKEAEFIKGDVRDYQALDAAVRGSDIICHKASAVGVGQSQYEIKKYVDVNTGGTANLLDIIVNKKYPIEKLIVAASMSSYGEGVYLCGSCGRTRAELRSPEQMEKGDWELHCPECNKIVAPSPTGEADELRCNSIYAITKKDQEEMVINIGRTYNIPVVSLRYFNVFGPRQSLSNPYTGVAAIFMSRIKNDNRPVVYEDGKQTRDFVSVHDIVSANILAMENEKADYQIFNVGTGKPLLIRSIAESLATLYGKEIKPRITNNFRKGDVRHCFADMTKIKTVLGFEPQVTFEDGMKELIEWSKGAAAEDGFEKASAELRERGLA